jgi:DNA-binding CsgD family transcriptional regulator
VAYEVVFAPGPDPSIIPALSPVEREIVGLLVGRLTNTEIARARGASTRTIANQLSSIMRKLGARRRVDVLSRLIAAGPADAATGNL